LKAGCYLTTLLSCLFLFCPASVFAQQDKTATTTIEGLVVGVSEGDQLTVNAFGTEIHVRLYGIAAPQTAKVDKFTGWSKAGQPYAEEAFRALSVKVLHQQVKVVVRSTFVFKTEPKQVALAIVYLDGRNINLEMVNDGWAWAYKRFSSHTDFLEYHVAEKRARIKRIGLWMQGIPQAPWEFQPQLRIKPKKHG
jgi:micrococcal nuclease